MTFSKLLDSTSKALVLDNSVPVDQFVSQCGVSVRRHISNHVHVPDLVIREFTRRPYPVDLKNPLIRHLSDAELVEIRHSDGEAESASLSRLTDDQISLGDGESKLRCILVFSVAH